MMMATESTAEVVAAVVGALEKLGEKYGTEAWSLSVQAAQSVGYFNIVTCGAGIAISVGLGYAACRIALCDRDVHMPFFGAIITGLVSALVATVAVVGILSPSAILAALSPDTYLIAKLLNL